MSCSVVLPFYNGFIFILFEPCIYYSPYNWSSHVLLLIFFIFSSLISEMRQPRQKIVMDICHIGVSVIGWS